ncbi:MAG: hypothetical protein QM687_08880 [Ferruginibacter sp.]
MQTKFLSVCLLLFVAGCHSKKEKITAAQAFDREKWAVIEESDYPHRESMYHDLMASDTLRMIPKDSIVYLLGQPNRTDSNYLFYTISQERMGFWPLHTKTMVIKLAGDSVDWIKIHQ